MFCQQTNRKWEGCRCSEALVPDVCGVRTLVNIEVIRFINFYAASVIIFYCLARACMGLLVLVDTLREKSKDHGKVRTGNLFAVSSLVRVS